MRMADLELEMSRYDLGERGDARRPPRDSVRAVQALVERGLKDEDLLLDCIEGELARLADLRAVQGLTPFHVAERSGARFALVCWWPGCAANPHEHNAWTVTAVVHNQLEVETFERPIAVAERRLERRSLFTAERGRVGHIYEPGIHAPRNPTGRWAMSLHVFSPNDRPSVEQEAGGPIPGLEVISAPSADRAPPPEARAEMDRQVLLRAHAAVLSGMRSARAGALLERLAERGDALTREHVADALVTHERTSRGTAAGAPLGLDTVLRRRSSVGRLTVRDTSHGALLLSHAGETMRPLLRLDRRAQPVLAFIASHEVFSASQLPGDLCQADRLAVATALVESCVMSCTEPPAAT